MLFSLTSKKLNASLATWCAPRRSCSRNIAVRNVFRALVCEQHLFFLLVLKICYVFLHILRPCPPEHAVRNVWRASSIPSVPPLGRDSGHLGRQAGLGLPGNPAPPGFWPPKAATECLAPPFRTSPRASSDVPSGILRSRLRHAYEVAWWHRAGQLGLGEPKTRKRERNSGNARADWSCYWVSPCGWKRQVNRCHALFPQRERWSHQ